MTTGLHRLLHLRPGEAPRLLWVGAIGIAYAAATAVGNDVAEAVFITRVGAEAMPLVYLAKGALDVLAAALYLPLARGRSERSVWLAALALYIATVAVARGALTGGGDASAFGLFIAHETAWTILTIHWGVFVLDVFDASQARRLFPILFTTARLGGVLAGVIVSTLAGPLGVSNLLLFAAGFAGITALLSLAKPGARVHRTDDDGSAPMEADAVPVGMVASWRAALESPLVRAIAWSTAAMVLVRYGLHMVALGEIEIAVDGDKEAVAAFLGTFGAVANAAGIVLGVFIVPRLLHHFGVGFANVLYAVCSIGAYVGLLIWPSLGAAVGARFVHVQLKDALKTPLSALFYGAEPPQRRAVSRAFIFGAAIPVATVLTALALGASKRVGDGLTTAALIGLGGAALFVAASWIQNARWRRRMVALLRWKLERAAPPSAPSLLRLQSALAPYRDGASDALLDEVARGLASDDHRLRAVAEEVLSETIPRARAHAIAAAARAAGVTAASRAGLG